MRARPTTRFPVYTSSAEIVVIIITYKGSDALRAPKLWFRPDGRYARPGERFSVQIPPRATHTQHFTNNYYHINIRIASDTNETTTIPIDRSSCSTTQYRRTWPTDRLSTRGSAPGPRWGRCPQTPVFSRFALVICRLALYGVLLPSSN